MFVLCKYVWFIHNKILGLKNMVTDPLTTYEAVLSSITRKHFFSLAILAKTSWLNIQRKTVLLYVMCLWILPVCCQEYPAVLRELSILQFLVFLTAERSCSDRPESSYRVQSQRWELGPDPAHWDQRGGCFWASGHDGLKEEMTESEEEIVVFQKERKKRGGEKNIF